MAGSGVCWQMIRHLKVNGVGVSVRLFQCQCPRQCTACKQKHICNLTCEWMLPCSGNILFLNIPDTNSLIHSQLSCIYTWTHNTVYKSGRPAVTCIACWTRRSILTFSTLSASETWKSTQEEHLLYLTNFIALIKHEWQKLAQPLWVNVTLARNVRLHNTLCVKLTKGRTIVR